jgi:hypothetical protein
MPLCDREMWKTFLSQSRQMHSILSIKVRVNQCTNNHLPFLDEWYAEFHTDSITRIRSGIRFQRAPDSKTNYGPLLISYC